MKQVVRRAAACAAVLATALGVALAAVPASQARPADDGLAAAAALNGMTPTHLRTLLREDPTAALDGAGRLLFRDPAPTHLDTADAAPAPAAPYALDQTFLLHSKPGSQRTIYLDFDGMTVTGTAWNKEGLAAGAYPAWSLDGNAATFSTSEQTAVQEIWQQVAEDYAPFDVDVTTADPGLAAIVRSSSGDQVYGTRALITPSDSAAQATCGGGCGGVAYMDVFNEVGGDHQPAWIFPQYLSNGAKYIGEAISHEVGHNLALEHDGNSEAGYDSGHSPWAPIMGAAYDQPITQWSKGDYADADNQQDDLAVIADSGLTLRADEAGGSIAQAADALPAGTAYVTTRADKDFYDLGRCSGTVGITALPAPRSPDLDIELRLYRADGTQVAIANPLSARVDDIVATGMAATISSSVPTGSYVVAVDGVGRGTPVASYDDYGSIGAYTLDVTGCSDAPVELAVPSAPNGVTAASGPTGTTADIGWAVPVDDGGSPITGYLVTVGDRTVPVGAGTTSYTATGLAPGLTYGVAVVAVNSVGTGPQAAITVTTAVRPDVPGLPVIVSAGGGTRGGKITASVRWQAPAVTGAGPVTGYRVRATRWSATGGVISTGLTQTLPATTRSVVVRLQKKGLWSFQVQATNSVGFGALSLASKRVQAR